MRLVPTNSFYGDVRRIIGAVPGGGVDDIASFEEEFARYVGVKRAFLVGSGTSALYVILKALGRFSQKDEVVLPAYTVPTLTLAVSRAGLTTRLCEIDRTTFNMDVDRLDEAVTKRTLAVVPVHLFGFPMDCAPVAERARADGFFVVEDAAQAPGASLNGRRVGGLGDVGFFSLCKGKIISTFRGGVITTDDPGIGEAIEEELRRIRTPGLLFDLRLFVTLIMLTAAVRPEIYGALFHLIKRFKSTTVHDAFEPAGATSFAARLALVQIGRLDDQVAARRANATTLMEGISGKAGVAVPRVIDGAVPSFNHLPVVIEEERAVEPLRSLLFTRGIDTARMYERPVHHVYDLGYARSPDPFPAATYMAQRLVILPTHPYVGEADVRVIIRTVREAI